MHYENIRKATFLARPNRFIAHVALEEGKPSARFADSSLCEGSQGSIEVCHVKNTGRCKELLVPGATVYIQEWDNPARKTKFDLIAVEKEEKDGAPGAHPRAASLAPVGQFTSSRPTRLINMDAQAPNKVFGEWAASGAFTDGLTLLKPETTWGKSRFDFYFEAESGGLTEGRAAAGDSHTDAPRLLRKGFVEVKGVTLEEDGAVYFPDAPTERGVKHVEELIACHAAGYEAYLCFIIQMENVKSFSPNDRTHPAFGEALWRAAAAGVHLLAYDCTVTPDSLALNQPVNIVL